MTCSIRRSTQLPSLVTLAALVALAALAGCGATPQEDASVRETSAFTRNPPPSPFWSNTFTTDALITGLDEGGAPEYSCRGAYLGVLTPGHAQKSWSVCEIGYGGQMALVSPYQILVAEWQAASNGTIPAYAFAVGRSGSGAAPTDLTYSCRATVGSSTQVGVTGPGFPGCVVAGGGVATPIASYEVLVIGSGFALTQANVAAGAALPYNAIQGGSDQNGAAEYPCTVTYGAQLVPGKTEPGWGYCDIASGPAEIQVQGMPYNVLVPSFVRPGEELATFIAGTDTSGAALGVCQASFKGTIQAGKYNVSDGECSFGYGAAGEVVATTFTILGPYFL